MLVIGKIVSANVSGTSLSQVVKAKPSLLGCSSVTSYSPSFLLSEVFQNYNEKKGTLYYRVANTMEELQKQTTKPKGNFLTNSVLHVSHVQRDTDIDSWFDSDVSFTFDGKKTSFNDICDKKVGKFICIEFVER